MRMRNPIRHVATPARVFMTLVVLLIAVAICQLFALESAQTFVVKAPAQEELTEEQERAEKLRLAAREFLPDGTLHLVAGDEPRDLPAHEEVYDANGTLLWAGPPKQRPYQYLPWAAEETVLSEGGIKSLEEVSPGSFRTLDLPVATATQTREIWRYCHRGDYFVGYATAGGHIGYVGGGGFAASQSQVRPFGPFRRFAAWCPTDSYSPTLVWQTRSRIYQIDFEQRQVEQLMVSPDSELECLYVHHWGALGVEETEAGTREGYRPLLVCRSADGKYHLLLKDPDQKLTVALPQEWEQWLGNLHGFIATAKGVFMWRFWVEYPAPPDHYATRAYRLWLDGYIKEDRTRRVELYRVNDRGDIDLVNSYSWQIPARTLSSLAWGRQYEAMQRATNVASPVFYDFLWWLGTFRPAVVYRGVVGQLIRLAEGMRPGLSVGSLLLTAVLVGLTFLHARPRRRSTRAFVFWLVFVGLFNLAGFLTYWALNHTATIKCSSCGKLRGLHQCDCVRCGVSLPSPERGKCDLIVGV